MKAEHAYSIRIYGRVQGVGFRYYTQQKAVKLGLTGFVSNKADGSVYIEVEGDELRLNEFLSWCQTGPQWAHVLKVQSNELPPVGYNSFTIK
ncbi:MAG: acylphosphatase [Bacteroidales bacterium]|nr:acylphosphatase [Bacteroidales bacterium]